MDKVVFVLAALAATSARAAPRQPGFEVVAVSLVDRATSHDVAAQRARAGAWREAFVRCGLAELHMPLPIGDIRLEDTATGAHGAPMVRATARFECGADDSPDLAIRMRAADVIVVGEVTSIQPVRETGPITEHAPHWQVATIRVANALKGTAPSSVQVYVPGSTDVAWSAWPHVLVGERAVWVVQPAQNGSTGATVPTALDVQAPELEQVIWSLLQRG